MGTSPATAIPGQREAIKQIADLALICHDDVIGAALAMSALLDDLAGTVRSLAAADHTPGPACGLASDQQERRTGPIACEGCHASWALADIRGMITRIDTALESVGAGQY